MLQPIRQTLLGMYCGTGGWKMLQHPPCSTDVNPCDCDMIPILKQPFTGKQFTNTRKILTIPCKVAQTSTLGDASDVCHLPCHWHWIEDSVCDVVLFISCSLCMPQPNSKPVITKSVLLASNQWLLYIQPPYNGITSTCHVLSNMHTPFPVLPHFWPKISGTITKAFNCSSRLTS